MGLDIYLHNKDGEIEIDDPEYPDHLFKIGYFRSSYNPSGLNNVLGKLGVDDLYGIFDCPGEGKIVPDWEESKATAVATLTKLHEMKRSPDSMEKVERVAQEASFDVIVLDGSVEDWLERRMQSIEIVIRTIDYVLSQEKRDEYFLIWSM